MKITIKTMKYFSRTASILCLLFSSITLSGQTHGWTVNPKDYGFDCEVNAIVFMGSDEVNTGTLGAFVDSTCRGYADGIYFPGTGKTIFSLRCYSDTTLPETITFKYFDPATNSYHNIIETVIFASDAQMGNALEPLIFHKCDPVTILANPLDISMCAVTGNTSLSVTVGGSSPFTYQWQYYTGTDWINVANSMPSGAIYTGSTTTTLGISGISAAGTYQYRCYITNCHRWSNVSSNPATLTVNELPVATALNNGPVCTGSVMILTGGPPGMESYVWSGPNGFSSSEQNPQVSSSATTLMAGTYTLTVTDINGCTDTEVTTVVITELPVASISYAGNPFCRSVSTAQSVTLTGTGAYTGGSYSSSPSGLSINSSTGAITPSTSTAGTYTVTYTIPASGGCSTVPVTTGVTITAVPTATISYAGNPFCRSVSTAQSVTLTGTGAYTGGTYSSSPSGLSINSSTGAITPSTSTAGTYTVTYTIPASGGCEIVTTTSSVTINPLPSAITGGNNVCEGSTITLNSIPTGGTWISSVPEVATINSSTGLVTGVSQGTSVITYQLAGCSVSIVFNVLPSDWRFDPVNFNSDGLVTAAVFMGNKASVQGFLAAYAGEECRGYVESTYYSPTGNYIFELNCYSNEEAGDVLTFKYFDPLNKIVYNMDRSVDFVPGMDVGTKDAPVIMNLGVSLNINLPVGWTWFSVNTFLDNMTLRFILSSVATPGDYIKDQTSSATYYAGFGWFGTLNSIDPTKLYKIKVQNISSVKFSGRPVNVNTTPITLVSGWNWIGYLPQVSLPLSDALSALSLVNYDYIKDQKNSATYYSSYGWFGNLTTMSPSIGYMMRISNSGTLIYPESDKKGNEIATENNRVAFNPNEFEFNGSVTAKVMMDGIAKGSENELLYAYVNNEIRGVIGGEYFKPENTWLYSLMIYSNIAQGEIIKFKYFDAQNNKYYDCKESITFASDMIVADAFKPLELNFISTNVSDNFADELRMRVYPNPFGRDLNIEYELINTSHVRITVLDVYGRVIRTLLDKDQKPDNYLFRWDSDLPPYGIYFIKFEADHKYIVQKVIVR